MKFHDVIIPPYRNFNHPWGSQGMDMQFHSTETHGCDYLSLP